ncbi:hypothetical protein DL762_008563 [Monosporascus cannonballus]|uniref:Palmitoyltransferase PFA4 n=1 Tax=Monosporascus cannonballus TaxID=155416 RepID=A0ABY0GZU8_9PEZI|nr:hypothetical protein DL762_008563 [Monosporascus cannonballus]
MATPEVRHPGDQHEIPSYEAHTSMATLKDRIKQHYDLASDYYYSLWGQHIHHGLFRNDGESKEEAQVNLINYLLGISRLQKGGHVLDVGCGIGGTSRFLAKEHGCAVTGITISGRQVEIAKRLTLEDKAAPQTREGSDLLSYDGKGAVRFLELDAEKMRERFSPAEGRPGETFDCVWISEALSHLPDKPLFFSSSFAVLAAGGSSRLVVADWFKAPGLSAEQEAADIQPIEDGMLLPKLCTADDYVRMAEEAGFKTLQAPIDISKDVAKTCTAPELQRLLVPFVCVLIAFLAYGSQWLFANAPDLAPGPLTPAETYVFNGLVCCLWWTYYKAVTVDPGRYVFPPDLLNKLRNKNKGGDKGGGDDKDSRNDGGDSDPDPDPDPDPTVDGYGRRRWCRKCAAPKPPRAHHCKTCGRCVPRMDHHCPWTANCVSLQSFPHFLRFLAYANLSLWALLYHVGRRFRGLWDARRLPAYLGPSAPQLALLTAVALAGGCAALALGILLATTVKGWLFNTTMIESWELERHEAVLERRPGYGVDGDGDGDGRGWWRGGEAVEPVEFPYDVGIFANMAQAMGTRNVLLWFWPFAGSPAVAPAAAPAEGPGEAPTTTTTMMPTGTGWRYEENGLNDREGMWPPVDPDKVRNARLWRRRQREMAAEEARQTPYRDPEEEREAFRRRQERALMRWRGARGRILGELDEVPDYEHDQDYDYGYGYGAEDAGRGYGAGGAGRRSGGGRGITPGESGSGWVNADGEKLGDYGVDEDAEFDDRPVVEGGISSSPPPTTWAGFEQGDQDDEEVPLAELIRRRKVLTRDGEDM